MPRNSSGIYTLPSGNPVVPETTIDTEWANPTLTDIAQALTDSLDRNGRGNMLAPFKFTDGTVAQPAIAFTQESSSGLYRPGPKLIGISIFGMDVAHFSATGLSVTGNVQASGNIGATGDATIGGSLGVSGDVVTATLTTGAVTTDTLSVNNVNAQTVSADTVVADGLLAAQTVQTDIGTAAAPAWSFAADNDTGFFSPAPGVIAVVTDGVERMRWSAAGTTNQIPPGAMMDYAGGVVPPGWLLCDGAAVSRTTYAALWAAIGGNWGAGDGSTTFNVPDMRRRVAIGSGGVSVSPPSAVLGQYGGAEATALAVANMPSHTHTVNDNVHSHGINDAAHSHGDSMNWSESIGWSADGNTAGGSWRAVGAASPARQNQPAATGITSTTGAATGISINAAGSGNAFSNMQPCAVVTKIIKV